MIRRYGRHRWKNVHATEEALLDDLVDVDNTLFGGPPPRGFELLRHAADELGGLVREARDAGKRLRALGSGWALTDIAVTDGWLVNTKLLNACFDLSPDLFHDAYPREKREYAVLAQCGISIAELNYYLEVNAPQRPRRALKTAGIGAGQTIAGAVSGNTHGAAVNFGATPDYVVGIQLVTGAGRSLWLERASQPVLNDTFVERLGAELVRDDDTFDAAVVSFGAFGIIAAVALETDPIYHLLFAPVADVPHDALKCTLRNFDPNHPPGLHHYEFIFDPYSRDERAMVAAATRVPFEEGHPAPRPVWIIRDERGFALGDRVASALYGAPLLHPRDKTHLQFEQYRERCILGDVRSTPGQLFTATITYLEGNTESAVAVSIRDAARTMDICTDVIRRMRLPAISQVRVVHPTRALLGFTHHEPRTVVFEFGLVNNAAFREFERTLVQALTTAGIHSTLHWSKNAGITPERLLAMYGASRVERWRRARRRVFRDDADLMGVFDNDHLLRSGLA